MSGPIRSIVPAVAVLLILASAAVTIALISTSADVEEFPAGSPEEAVQRYVQALQERDYERAYDMLSERERDDTTIDEFRSYQRFQPDPENRRIRVESVDINGDRATVQLTIEQFQGTGLDFARNSYRRTVPLLMEDGEWKIDDAFIGII